MPWMFSSTFSLIPYLFGWLGFLAAVGHGLLKLIFFSKPARSSYVVAYAAGVLLTAGDLVYQLDLARSVDSSWSGLTAVPERLIGSDGSLRPPVSSAYAYPPVRTINADIMRFWWRVGILGLGLLAYLTHRWVPEDRVSGGGSVVPADWTALLMGVTGYASLALGFVL